MKMAKIPFDIDKEFLKENVEYQIDRMRINRKRDKSKTSKINLFSGFAAAATTALIGLSKYNENLEDVLQVSALIISAALTIVLSWDKLFQHKELWLISARGLRKFFELKEDIDHAEKTGSLTPELLKDLYARYKSILEEGVDSSVKCNTPRPV